MNTPSTISGKIQFEAGIAGPAESLLQVDSQRVRSKQSLMSATQFIRFLLSVLVCSGFFGSGFYLNAAQPSTPEECVVVEKGRSAFQIVLPRDSIASERYAAEELQRYVKALSGVTLEIVDDQSRPKDAEIILGATNHRLSAPSAGALPSVASDALGTDGFLLQTTGKGIFVAGGRPRGTLNAVYTLLEEYWGVRWYAPKVEKVPATNRLVLPSMNRTVVPELQARDVFWSEFLHNPDFAARHRVNGPHYQLADKHGGPAVKYYPFVHSFDELIPRSLFKDHPEYFPWINGKRVDGYVQRCLANEEVVQLSIQRVKQWIKDHPEANIISVSQNDTHNQCRCEKCLALDEAEGSPAASMLRFVNRVAEAVEADHPNLLIDTLAYQYTRKPPKTIKPRKNVLVRLCSIECCFSHSLEQCSSKENAGFRQDIMAWQPVAKALYIWDYTPNFGHYLQPFPNFDALQQNVQFFVRHNVKGLFEQGNYSGGGGGEMEPLRAYLLAKLLWNPYTDVSKHMTDFLEGYYGKSAGAVRGYMDRLHANVRNSNAHAHIFDSSKAAYLDDSFLADAIRILDAAVAGAENDDIRFRLEMIRIGVWYVKIATSRVQGEEKNELIRRLMTVARKAGISDIREAGPIEAWATKQLGGTK